MKCQSELNSGSVTVKSHFYHLAFSTSFASTTTMNLSSASELALTQTPAPRRYTIGSRASKLATIQAEIVLEALQKLHPHAIFNLEYMTTEGDKNQSQALYLLGGKALWTKELEVELLEGKIDLIVHSLKDVPTTLPPGCELAAILEREEPADCLVMKQGLEYKSLDELPDGSVIGTSSVRRVAQLRRLYPKLQFADVRGNLNTRLAKLDKADGEYTAIILAAAGLMRLGFSDRITALLKPPTLYHAVGQASLGVEIRSDDETTKQLIAGLTHPESNLMCRAERACLKVLEGGCSVPVGVASSFERKEGADEVVGTLKLMGTVTSLSGTSHVESTLEAEVSSVEDAENLGARLARKLIDSGAKTILEEIEKAKKERQEQEKTS
ncbi:porphobilinogen deaminase [Tulasnella sp. UAMH 9824]|nr:porphobilinogen deaminase [Tulasnella sp. UAMH 9824]